jgi:predicted Zn-dependent protease
MRRAREVLRAAAILALTGGILGGRALAQTTEPAEAARAAVPLTEIKGFAVPATQTGGDLASQPGAQARYEQARKEIEDRQFGKALETLDALLQDPAARGYESYHLRALALARLGRVAEARDAGRLALAYRPDGVDAHFLLGGLSQQQGQLDDAIAHFRSATLAAERELNNTKVTLSWLLLGQVLAQRGYLLAASQAYERFDTAIWVSHEEQRNADEIQQFLRTRPHGALELRLELLEKLGRKAEAADVSAWAVKTWPEDVEVARFHAAALLDVDRANEAFQFCLAQSERREFTATLLPTAIAAARAADRLEAWIDDTIGELERGESPTVAVALARLLAEQQSPEPALRLAAALAERRPLSFELAWQVADVRYTAGDVHGALEALIGFVREHPKQPAQLLPKLAVWTVTPEGAEGLVAAVADFPRAQAQDFAANFVLGLAAAAANRDALSDGFFNACSAADPGSPWVRIARAQVHLGRFDWAAARDAAQELLKQDAKSGPAHFVLAQALDGLDDPEAEKEYRAAVKAAPDEPAYKLALAEHCRRRGDLLGAQRFYQEALLAEPTLGAAAEGLIECYVLDDKREMAREQYLRLDMHALPADSVRRITTTMRYLAAPFGEEHLAELRRQFDEHPRDFVTGRLLAAGLFVWRRTDEAAAVLARVRAVKPDDYASQVLQANLSRFTGAHASAIETLRLLSERYPNRREVLALLADSCLAEYRIDECREIYRRLIACDPENRDDYRLSLLDTYDKFGETDGALALLEEWQRETKDPDELAELNGLRLELLVGARRYADALRFAGERLDAAPAAAWREQFVRAGLAAREFATVEARIREWLSKAPDDADLTEWLVETLSKAGRTSEALETARKFEGDWSAAKRRRFWMARCQAEMGNSDAAIKELDALLSERLLNEVETRRVRAELMLTLVKAKRYDDAVQRCDAWLSESAGQDVGARYTALSLKRQVLMEAKRDAEYVQVMEELLALTPDDPGLNNDLGYTWVDHGTNVPRATEMIRLAVRAEPLNAAFLDSLGWAYYKAGDFAQARLWLGRATRLREGRDATVWDHAGDAAFRDGDAAAAEKCWKEALALVEAADPDRDRPLDAEFVAGVRAKLQAIQSGQAPAVAATAPQPEAAKGASTP